MTLPLDYRVTLLERAVLALTSQTAEARMGEGVRVGTLGYPSVDDMAKALRGHRADLDTAISAVRERAPHRRLLKLVSRWVGFGGSRASKASEQSPQQQIYPHHSNGGVE